MLARHRKFQWQHNYFFTKKSSGTIILNYLILIVFFCFFLWNHSTVIDYKIRTLLHETDNFKGWTEIKSWNLIEIYGVAKFDVTRVK